MLIGESIQDAIDWTQDRLATTRPLAEGTLFSLMADKMVRETELGYVLLEAAVEEIESRHVKMRSARGRMRFHHRRINSKKTVGQKKKYTQKLKQMKRIQKPDHLDYPDSASAMDSLPEATDALS